ncbi:hypothetical protein BH09BAC6_BH09BAC6_08130 [soil metagenome]|jgi:hypothetical protein
MTDEEKLKQISGDWISSYKKTKLLTGAKLLIGRIATIISVLVVPSILFLSLPPLTKIEGSGVAIIVLIVSVIFSVKLAPKYSSYSELVSGLEKERDLFIAKKPPYAEKNANTLFVIKNKKHISDSYSVTGDVPDNFTAEL